MNFNKYRNLLKTLVLIIGFGFTNIFSQSLNYDEQKYEIMDRGMIWQTMYNSGMISQVWNLDIRKTNLPFMQWPARSAFTYNSIEYSGMQNSVGGAIYLSANVPGLWGVLPNTNRMASFAGGVGKSSNVVAPWGHWTYPIKGQSIERVENYPVLEDGSLNPNFDPNEAELKVTTKWAMSDQNANMGLGVTVTRVSRQWSYPDYDDMIIHEYTFENTGDINGDGVSEVQRTLVDVLAQFVYGMSPSMYGSQRYNSYEWVIREDQTAFWDPSYWMQYNQVLAVRGDTLLAGRPETDPANFKLYAQTGLYGGGLMSPAAAGFAMLYYDTDHLEIIDYNNPDRNESFQVVNLKLIKNVDSTGNSINLRLNGKPKQPWGSYQGKDPAFLDKIWDKIHRLDERMGEMYPLPENNITGLWVPDPIWIGRLNPISQGGGDKDNDHPFRSLQFGPYKLEYGQKIKFAVAEVVGYGASRNHNVVGGRISGRSLQPIKGTDWHKRIRVSRNGITSETMDYLNDYGYPDYVNSNVRTVQDVAHKAFEAYAGKNIPLPETWTVGNPQCWPENNPANGVYNMPIPIPAPKLDITSTSTGDMRLNWGKQVEEFERLYPARVSGKLVKFNIYRADFEMGPWKLMGSVNKNSLNDDGLYEFLDIDKTFKIEESKFYSVTSVDEHGNESGKTNFTKVKKIIGAVDKLGKVYVVPNPFVLNSGYMGNNAERMLGFYGLPKKCTIYIFSFSGQRVMTIEHNAPVYSNNWRQVTINHQDLASGMYFFVVTTPEGDKSTGKFVVIK
ncbi:MAG: T9SS type A sorting domain-containing protein [Melioribacteraceae bacterium]